jgi:hypothetical protein
MTTAATSTAVKTAKASKPARKTAKTSAPAADKPKRRPAKELMAERTRLTFGPAYFKAVKEGKCKDIDKMIYHANSLKMGTVEALRGWDIEKLRTKLGEKIGDAPENFKLDLVAA